MIQKINSEVSVKLIYSSKEKRVYPEEVIWNGRSYPIIKIGLHHTFKKGKTLYHGFSVTSKTLFFRLILNTDNLHWFLEQIADEYTN